MILIIVYCLTLCLTMIAGSILFLKLLHFFIGGPKLFLCHAFTKGRKLTVAWLKIKQKNERELQNIKENNGGGKKFSKYSKKKRENKKIIIYIWEEIAKKKEEKNRKTRWDEIILVRGSWSNNLFWSEWREREVLLDKDIYMAGWMGYMNVMWDASSSVGYTYGEQRKVMGIQL